MRRQDLIKEIERIKDLLVDLSREEVGDYAREHAYYSLDNAADLLEENYNE